jgi:hypothetical protein
LKTTYFLIKNVFFAVYGFLYLVWIYFHQNRNQSTPSGGIGQTVKKSVQNNNEQEVRG